MTAWQASIRRGGACVNANVREPQQFMPTFSTRPLSIKSTQCEENPVWDHSRGSPAGFTVNGCKKTKRKQTSCGEKVMPEKTLTNMSREFVVIRADERCQGAVNMITWVRSRINTTLHPVIQRICCCCEHVCAENLPCVVHVWRSQFSCHVWERLLVNLAPESDLGLGSLTVSLSSLSFLVRPHTKKTLSHKVIMYLPPVTNSYKFLLERFTKRRFVPASSSCHLRLCTITQSHMFH